MEIHATLSIDAITLTPPFKQTHRAKSGDQNSPHDLVELFVSFSRSRSLPLVNSRNVYQALETLFRTGGRGMQF